MHVCVHFLDRDDDALEQDDAVDDALEQGDGSDTIDSEESSTVDESIDETKDKVTEDTQPRLPEDVSNTTCIIAKQTLNSIILCRLLKKALVRYNACLGDCYRHYGLYIVIVGNG